MKLGVMYFLWMLVICFWEDHGNMIEELCMMGIGTHTFVKDGVKNFYNHIYMNTPP